MCFWGGVAPVSTQSEAVETVKRAQVGSARSSYACTVTAALLLGKKWDQMVARIDRIDC